MHRFEWRPPRREDDAEWAALLAAVEAVDGRGETYDLDDLADQWASAWSHPATDAVFAWLGPELVAFGWIRRQVADPTRSASAHHLDCWGGVRPDHRGQGLGRQLLRWQLDRARQIAADLTADVPTMPVTARLDVLDSMHDLRHLAEREGFAVTRTFLELVRPIDPGAGAPVPDAPVPEGLLLRPWSEALDEATRAAHADAFAGHWGSEPSTADEWRQWYTGHRSSRPDLSVVLVDPAVPHGSDGGPAAGREHVVAFALCAAYPQDWHAVPREVWLNAVGTRPAWRGRGAARAVVAAVLSAARSAAEPPGGFERAILGVDSGNATGAVALYRSMGFHDLRQVHTLTLVL